jgi:predicted nucleic acid-binding protein
MKLLIDTNVILDMILKREPFYKDAIDVLELVKQDGVQEYVSASAVTDIYYIAYRTLRDRKQVLQLMKELFVIVNVAGVTQQEIQKALELTWNDFEDSVQYAVALLQEMDGIVSRNAKDYEDTEIQVLAPKEAIKMFG